MSAYGLSKLTAEQYIQLYAKEFKFNYTIFRYANVYGPRQDPKGEAGVIAIFANNLIQNKPSIIYGSGKQTRDFVYVSDVASANVLALSSLENKIVNIGTGKTISVNELYQTLSALAKSTLPASFQSARNGELMHSCLDRSLAQKTLQWSPKVSLAQGLEFTLKYFSEK
jgi:UDP-glucose 4-epimerase